MVFDGNFMVLFCKYNFGVDFIYMGVVKLEIFVVFISMYCLFVGNIFFVINLDSFLLCF